MILMQYTRTTEGVVSGRKIPSVRGVHQPPELRGPGSCSQHGQLQKSSLLPAWPGSSLLVHETIHGLTCSNHREWSRNGLIESRLKP